MLSRRAVAVVVALAVTTLVAIVVVLVLTAPPAQTPGEGEGGPGLPVQLPGDTYAGDPVAGEGELVLGEEGCFRVDLGAGARFAIWPEGFSADGDAVLDADGTRLVDGARLTVEGLVMPYGELVAIEGPDGYWANVAGFCIGYDDTVLVLDEVTRAD